MSFINGDIDDDTTDEDLEYYCEDKTFADLMERFLDLMTVAKKTAVSMKTEL